MASTPEQRSRRAAQRATAARVREARGKGGRYRPVLPTAVRAPQRRAREAYGYSILESGQRPSKDSPEGRNLGSLASLASRGRADPAFLAFQDYWYHKKDEETEADIEDTADYEDEEAEDE